MEAAAGGERAPEGELVGADAGGAHPGEEAEGGGGDEVRGGCFGSGGVGEGELGDHGDSSGEGRRRSTAAEHDPVGVGDCVSLIKES